MQKRKKRKDETREWLERHIKIEAGKPIDNNTPEI